jgi:hypothetical protein
VENEEAVEVNLKRSGLSRLTGRQPLRVQILCQQLPPQNTRPTATPLRPLNRIAFKSVILPGQKGLANWQLDRNFDFLSPIFLSFGLFASSTPTDFAS